MNATLLPGFESRRVDVDGVAVNCAIAGSGPPVLMLHGYLDVVYDRQGGPRGDEKVFLPGMFMAMAQRDVGERGTWGLRAMLSPDPLIGKKGYPLLLQTGETADGSPPASTSRSSPRRYASTTAR